MGQEFLFLVKEIKLHLWDPGHRYIDTEINFNIFIVLSNSSTYFNFNKCFIGQKNIFGSLALNKSELFPPQQRCPDQELTTNSFSVIYNQIEIFLIIFKHESPNVRLAAALYSPLKPAINHLYYQFSCHILRSGRAGMIQLLFPENTISEKT